MRRKILLDFSHRISTEDTESSNWMSMAVFLNSPPQWWLGWVLDGCCYHSFLSQKTHTPHRDHPTTLLSKLTKPLSHTALHCTEKRKLHKFWISTEWITGKFKSTAKHYQNWGQPISNDVKLQVCVMANQTTLATVKSLFSFVSKSSFRTFNSSKNCELLHTPCKLWRLFDLNLEKSDTKIQNTLGI